MTRRDVLAGFGLLSLVAPMLRLRCAEGAQLPGTPAPADVRAAIESTIRTAIARLEARDLNGVLLHVSEQYRTEDVTKAVLRQQLDALFSLYDALRVQLRVDMMTAVGDTAWIWSTGELSGRLPGIGAWIPTFTWEQQPEGARRENGSWRLYGLQ
jgi:hypothetical protein